MVEATEKLFEEMETCLDDLINASGFGIRDIKCIDETEFKSLKSLFKLMDSTKEYQLKQAKMIDTLNKELINVSRKLDKLLIK